MSEWIEYDGKGMPIDGETRVFVLFRDKTDSLPSRAKRFDWRILRDSADIIAYQIVTED